MRKKAFWLALLFGVLLLITGSTLAQSGVRVVVVNEFANVRVVPAIGAEVRGTVPAGWVFEIVSARSPDNEWLRVDFNGDEGWVNVATLVVLSGSIASLPVADPRTIPYGGFESPRAGLSNARSNVTARLTSGLRVRAGPSRGYPVLADAPRNSVVPLLGRTSGNSWIQINFDGTLGWVATQYLEILGGASIATLPIDGVVADSLPISRPVAEDFVATIRLLLARVDLAQPSLDSIRASWTDSALTGRASCQPYPARPSAYNIPNQLLAAYYPTLNPLQTLFNDAMYNVRLAIDLFIQACNQPGTANPVGQATVIGALEVVALADRQFAELRSRLASLIPEDREIGPNECLFTFQGSSEVLPLIQIGQIVRDGFTPNRTVAGYCFDAIQGQALVFESLQLGNSNVVHLLAVSPFDNPTNFIATGRGREGTPLLTIGPVLISTTGRYLLILNNVASPNAPISGDFAALISQVTPGSAVNTFLFLDPVTGQPTSLNPTAPTAPTLAPGIIVTTTPSFSGQSFSPGGSGEVCPGTGLTCEQLASCEQAYACLAAGNFSLDPDGDGIPCEVLRCPSGP